MIALVEYQRASSAEVPLESLLPPSKVRLHGHKGRQSDRATSVSQLKIGRSFEDASSKTQNRLLAGRH